MYRFCLFMSYTIWDNIVDEDLHLRFTYPVELFMTFPQIQQ